VRVLIVVLAVAVPTPSVRVGGLWVLGVASGSAERGGVTDRDNGQYDDRDGSTGWHC
jgi:hypothetical protein